jgi:TolB-like protein/Tfp pilus assembly protein PilF
MESQNPFLAILPLEVLPDDPKLGIFCQGVVIDLITDLSRFRSFQILSYDTTKALQPDEGPESRAFRELDLDYVVKGMVRQQQEKLLFNLQLINLRGSRVVWAEKFSGALEDLFHIQEDIVEKIVVSLQHFVDYDLLREMRKRPRTSLNAYECWLRGYQELKKGTLATDEHARGYFQQAMELDPHYARAYTGMSLSFFNEWSCQLWSRWEVSQNGAFEWAQRALELDEWDHMSNAILGRLHVFRGEYEKAEHYLRKSLRINSNDAETLILISYGFVYLGYPAEARDLYERARRLNPADNPVSHAFGAFVHFEMGSFDEAIALGKQLEIGKGWVDFPAFMAAAYFQKGDLENMEKSWRIFLDEFSQKINGGKPTDTRTALQWMINVNPYRGTTRLKPFWEHMSRGNPVDLVVAQPESAMLQPHCFRQEGGMWKLSFGGDRTQLPDLKGYHDLAQLLARPHHAIHCTQLMGAQVLEDGEAVFDEKAKTAYHQRIQELQEEIEEVESLQDSERLAALHEEYDRLLEHLTRLTGKGGKTRKVSGSIEKCRSAVTWRIRSAIKRIAESHPGLGKHLAVSIKTGVFCEYAPEHEVDWTL